MAARTKDTLYDQALIDSEDYTWNPQETHEVIIKDEAEIDDPIGADLLPFRSGEDIRKVWTWFDIQSDVHVDRATLPRDQEGPDDTTRKTSDLIARAFVDQGVTGLPDGLRPLEVLPDGVKM